MAKQRPREAEGHEDMVKLIGRYEFGALSDEEQRAFEEHLLECDACFEELERGSVIAHAMRDEAHRLLPALQDQPSLVDKMLASFGEWLREAYWQALRPRVAVPVAALSLGALLAVVAHVTGPGSYARLATFPSDEVSSTTLRAPKINAPVRELMEAGAGYFNLGQYDDAQKYFLAALEREPGSAEAAYLLGLSKVFSGQVKDAIPYLEKGSDLARGDLRGKATWTLANAYLKAGQLEEARGVLGSLKSSEGAYSEKARDLLEKLPR